MKKALKEKFQIPLSHVEVWLEENGFTWEQVERGVSFRGERLTASKIEEYVSAGDPVIWAFLNLVSPMNIPGLCKAGDPLKLLPIQAQLARLEGNVIAECAAEVGKTQDIGVRLLHRIDTAPKGDTCLIVTNTEKALKSIWRYIRDEVKANPLIGGGVERIDKREMSIEFKNGNRFETRITGADGESLRGAHITGIIFADEVVKYTNLQIWNELWRCAMPGAVFRVYTTPDGNYSCPYYALSLRATQINEKNFEAFEAVDAVEAPDEFTEIKFKKIWISKRHLGPPLFTEKRLAGWRQKYNGEHTVGFLNNVDGLWGTPSSSVFPMYVLEPTLAWLPDYRIVCASIDREKGAVKFDAAELSEEKKAEIGLAHTNEPFDITTKAANLARLVASFFPPAVASWVKPRLYCGADLGAEQDPSEYIWIHARGEKWIDVFRLHLEYASYPEQCQIVIALDHASGHITKYAFDAGNAGNSVAMDLQQLEEYRYCPICRLGGKQVALHFEERIVPFNFGSSTDEIDFKTGRPILDSDNRNAAGEMQPFRLSNLEFSTRVLERKLAACEMALARDAGAGNPQLGGAQLMTNHTSSGEKSKKGERRFRGKDDHLVAARRLLALILVSELRGERFISPELGVSVATSARRATNDEFDLGLGRMDFDDFGGSGGRVGFFDGFGS